ncbi:LytR/AlgR family response regulator transcription factor [Hydrotalea sandarakina]|jgi:two-component system LytT family response regulator|uniref:LytTR family two component transcriptional regulator n=1 Tax=Hydrotalea sandarakina TaxID=1004304 RepID=A0A2W7RSE6_9BACT|nr:LytTR family DNA-binding domain-containing protein [Hydrotalea sandarakina]PZX63658.1 LytTR family two component transcriptional regulator [Hydrotalea sandarakina]
MQVLIIEKDILSAKRLKQLLHHMHSNIVVELLVCEINEAYQWFATHQLPDAIFMNVELKGGNAFELLGKQNFKCPIIFMGTQAAYSLDIFNYFSIHYLLKPITKKHLKIALDKLQLIKQFKEYPEESRNGYMKQFWGRLGSKQYLIPISDISFFKSENKLVNLFSHSGQKFLINYNLDELETQLNPAEFFRINRSYIIHQKSINYIKPFINQRLKTFLKFGEHLEEAIVSRPKAIKFKGWAMV